MSSRSNSGIHYSPFKITKITLLQDASIPPPTVPLHNTQPLCFSTKHLPALHQERQIHQIRVANIPYQIRGITVAYTSRGGYFHNEPVQQGQNIRLTNEQLSPYHEPAAITATFHLRDHSWLKLQQRVPDDPALQLLSNQVGRQ